MPEAVLPLSLVVVPIAPDMLSEAIRLVIHPLSNILILALPQAIPRLQPI